MSDGLIFRIKNELRKYPKLFFFFYYATAIFTGVTAKKAIQEFPQGSRIINLGSGIKVIREDVINVDIEEHPNVSVVADVHKLPFETGSVDAVIAEMLFEHLEHPEAVIQEIERVLKRGGLLYITVPFMLGFHSSPGDYRRWTTTGLRTLLRGFNERKLGVAMGPTNALTYAIREWLSLALSFNSGTLYQLWTLFFLVILAPLNLLDFLFARFKAAENFCYAFYFIGTKR